MHWPKKQEQKSTTSEKCIFWRIFDACLFIVIDFEFVSFAFTFPNWFKYQQIWIVHKIIEFIELIRFNGDILRLCLCFGDIFFGFLTTVDLQASELERPVSIPDFHHPNNPQINKIKSWHPTMI